MNLIAKMTEYGTTYNYYINEWDEIVRTGDGQRVCYPSWSGDVLSEDLPNMEITYMRKYVCDFYLDESNVEDWFEDYASVVEKIKAYKEKRKSYIGFQIIYNNSVIYERRYSKQHTKDQIRKYAFAKGGGQPEVHVYYLMQGE